MTDDGKLPDYFTILSQENLKRLYKTLTPEEKKELRNLAIKTCVEAMLGSNDQMERIEAYNVLITMMPELKVERIGGWKITDFYPGRWGN